ncbi:MAG: prolipoprotein diacylglyceryl transferase [Proteobacteria bacterium]|nr:prolipoprotein diacylglyceryl transferase [Pseudomonadota bacterium]
MDNGIVFDLDPVMLRFGSYQIRYYGAFFTVGLWAAFFCWGHYMKRAKFTSDQSFWILPWCLGGLIIGARLGHCFFYEPAKYLSDPIKIIYFWKGGLSSHGATIGILISLLGYSRSIKTSYLNVVDRFSLGTAIVAASVRIGNFANSEIVGRETDLPWAVRFVRYDQGTVARHPTQIYEFLLGIFVLVALLIADRLAGKESRPIGLITGLFALLYFGGRFFVEFLKEYQRIDEGWSLTMGQWLCMPFFAIGIGLIIYAKKVGRRPDNCIT